MARNFSREARLSRLYANKIVLRAFIAILLYCFAINLVVGCGSLYVLGYFTTKMGSTMKDVITIAVIVLGVELFAYILIKLLFIKAEMAFKNLHVFCTLMFLVGCACIYLQESLAWNQMMMLIIIAAAALVFTIIQLFMYMSKVYIQRPQYYKETLKSLKHNKKVEDAKVRMLHGLWRAMKWGAVPEGKTKADVQRQKEEVVRLLQEHRQKARQAKRRVVEYKEFFLKNRYAKNEFVETRYRRASRYMHQVENTFVVMVSVFVFIFFAIMTILAARLPGDGSLWDSINSANNPEYFYFYVTMGVVFVFHFICAILAGSVTQVKLNDHEVTYVNVRANARIEGSQMSLHPDYNARDLSVPRKWDDSSAILEEKPREYKLAMFFFRNAIHVLFGVIVTLIFVYLTPALNALANQENETYALIFKILNILLIDAVTGAMYYALSTREYEYDCMDEHLMYWRYRHTAFLAIFILLSAAYLVLMLMGWSEGAFPTVPLENIEIVTGRIYTSLGLMFGVSIMTFLANLIMLPKERKKVNRDVMVFSNLDEVTNQNNDDYYQYYN